MQADHDASLRRVLSGMDATAIVVGSVIGVGIFFTPSRVASLAGSGEIALAAWIGGGLIALLGALSFAELGGMSIGAGGQYTILRDAYGPFPAFLFVFCNSTAIQSGASAIIAVVCVQNLAVVFGGQSAPADAWLASLLIVGVAMANIAGVRWGASIQNVTALAKVLTLAAVILLAMFRARHSFTGATSEGSMVGSTGLMARFSAALVPTCFTYGGWQHVLWMAGEVRDPARNLPRAILRGMFLVIVVYVLVNWAYLALLGPAAVAASQTPAADAVGAAWANVGRRAFAAAVAVSAFGVLNEQLLAGPRLVYGMARDGRFFRIFGEVSPRWRTPYASILLIAVVALMLLALGGSETVNRLLTGVVTIDSTFFALTGLAVIVLRYRQPFAPRSMRVPGYPWVPLGFAVCQAGIVIATFFQPDVRAAAYVGALWIVAAAVCFYLFFRTRALVNDGFGE